MSSVENYDADDFALPPPSPSVEVDDYKEIELVNNDIKDDPSISNTEVIEQIPEVKAEDNSTMNLKSEVNPEQGYPNILTARGSSEVNTSLLKEEVSDDDCMIVESLITEDAIDVDEDDLVELNDIRPLIKDER